MSKKIVVAFGDDEDIYLKLIINEKDLEKVKELTEKYKEECEDYDDIGLVDTLAKAGIKFEEVPMYWDEFINF